MGRKKILGAGLVPVVEDLKPFCYYCDREFDTIKTLVQHQQAKHFCCQDCGLKFDTTTNLRVHMLNAHKKKLTEVAGALPGRDSPDIVIHGMDGVPQFLKDEKAAANQPPPLPLAPLVANGALPPPPPPPLQGVPPLAPLTELPPPLPMPLPAMSLGPMLGTAPAQPPIGNVDFGAPPLLPSGLASQTPAPLALPALGAPPPAPLPNGVGNASTGPPQLPAGLHPAVYIVLGAVPREEGAGKENDGMAMQGVAGLLAGLHPAVHHAMGAGKRASDDIGLPPGKHLRVS